MTFRAIKLPERYALGAQGGPAFVTVIAQQESGDEGREGTIEKALGRWTISYEGKRGEIADDFRDFFYIVGGRLDTWMFWDALDFDCSRDQSYLEELDDSPTTWQMWKTRTFGSLTYRQKIILPDTSLTTVFGGGTYVVSGTTGIISKTVGPNPTSFDCRMFYKLARFDTDHLIQTVEQKKGDESRGGYIVSYAGIPIIEVPLSSA